MFHASRQLDSRVAAVHHELILAKYVDRKDEEYFSRQVTHVEIMEKEYDLSVTSYILAEDKRVHVDIRELNDSIAENVARQSKLRKEIDAIVASLESTSK